MEVGLLLSDVPAKIPPQQHFTNVLRIVEAAQRNGFTYIAIGQHFLYGDLRWLQPVPLLARLGAETGPDVKLVTQIMVTPLYHPVVLAEELATLDIVTEGRLVFGSGLGYRREEFDYLGVPYKERAPRMEEALVLMKRLMTEEKVDFDGRFWKLEGARPHIHPVQRPHPPFWIGAFGLPGVRRAGRIADAYAPPPEMTHEQLDERYEIVRREFELRGRPLTRQPVRRNVMVASSREEAIREYVRFAKDRYVTYAQRGLDVYDSDQLERDFLKAVGDHAVLGSPDEVVAELTETARRFPVDPLLLRVQWPSMSVEETLAVIDRLGRDVVPALREFTSADPATWRGTAASGDAAD